MVINVSGRLIAWLAAHGYLGESIDYWRTKLRAPAKRGGRLVNRKIPNKIFVDTFDENTDALLQGMRKALNAEPCRLAANSVKPTRRAANGLEALKRSQGYEAC